MSEDRQYEVRYKVAGIDGEHIAGPYSLDDAHEHKRDIAGFEGVYDARVEPYCAPCVQAAP